ncbi:MAG: hypothetical protein DRQ65_08645 [Gammaproteobacteria bacterium]|nr:MAG: hypothetical protein DRQ65_08645 [Gammaproteobacteria bacterium]
MNLVVKIAAGILLAGLVVGVGRVIVVTVAANQAQKQIQSIGEDLRRKQLARVRQTNAEKAKKLRQAQLQKELEEAQRKLAWKKEQAFFKYYAEPEDCLNYESDAHMVECVNSKMRARGEFNAKWVANQIPY